MRHLTTLAVATAATLTLAGCTIDIQAPTLPTSTDPSSTSTTKSAPVPSGGASTVTNQAMINQAKAALGDLETVPDDYPEVDGYERDCGPGDGCVFGPSWSDDNTIEGTGRNGCDTRNDVLAAQIPDARREDGSDCVVVSGTYIEPYFGTTETFERGEDTATQEEIDHVYALHTAWDLGAHAWDEGKRVDFANDTALNLLVTTRAANSGGHDVDGDGYTDRKDLGEYPGKSDKTMAEWLEWMDGGQRACQFAARYTLVADRYGLPITESDAAAAQEAFDHC